MRWKAASRRKWAKEGPLRGAGQRERRASKAAGAGGGEPEGAGQAEVAGGGLEGDGGGLLLEQGLDALGGAEVGLADDAGLAVDARLETAT